METTEVIICGCGPTGAMLASNLDLLGIKSICIEKTEGITDDPRGIALDEDGIRALQSVGLYDKIYTDIGQCMGVFSFVSGVHSDLSHAPFMSMDYTTSEGGTGHVGFICHKQPHLEKYLRNTFAESEHCQLRENCTLTSISEDSDWVYATYVNGAGQEQTIRGKFLVGADGKTGFTRKKYLEPKGILMKHVSQTTYEETWVAVNWKITLPTPSSHPSFPLWRLGYSATDVFDIFFPPNFRFLCNPVRPAVCGRFGTPLEKLWRFEFVVRPGEDGDALAGADGLARIIGPYITHIGARYGLDEDVAFPTDCIETLRSRPFLFAARSCNRWACDRVILCGDSAHVFPPFGGQGLASGFRDACSLAWRLKVACRFGTGDYGSLLEAWYLERKQQLDRSLASTVENGAYVTESNPLKILFRDVYLWLVQLVPSWKRQLEQGARRHGLLQYSYQPGMHFLPDMGGGLLLPQVYCSSQDFEMSKPGADEAVSMTDDHIFSHEKRGLFQLVVIISTMVQYREVFDELQSLQSDHDYVLPSEATIIVQDPQAQLSEARNGAYQTVRVATASEFAASPLCNHRPVPTYYDERRMCKELSGKRYVVVRPDRFVFAACTNKGELEDALTRIGTVLRETKKT